MTNEKVKLDINIGGEHILLTVPYDEQESVRDTERAIGELFDRWRKKIPNRTDSQIIAMLAYQYASFYGELLRREQRSVDMIQDCTQLLDELK